jgi:hypothetical protein
MISRTPINNQRIRNITGSFSWLDHRLLADGYLQAMSADEILLYFFLVLVGDKNGISFYSYDKVCALLKLDVDRFIAARNRLMDRDLIAAEQGRFQVLQLPEHHEIQRSRSQQPARLNQSASLAQLLRQMLPPQ